MDGGGEGSRKVERRDSWEVEKKEDSEVGR